MENLITLFKNVHWKFAKTMPHIPHWYMVRWDYPELDSDFVESVKLIRKYGEKREFQGVKYTYLDLGDWMLWTEGDPLHDTPEEARLCEDNTTIILNVAHRNGIGPEKSDPNNYLKYIKGEDLFYYLTAFLR